MNDCKQFDGMQNNDSLIDILKKFHGKKIAVIGDLMLDHYIIGDVHRISPEAPVPVVKAQKDLYTPGGAANVAVNLANLGLHVYLIGYVADDETGDTLTEELKKNRIDFLFPPIDATAPTIIKTRVIIRGQQLCRIDREGDRHLYNLAVYDNYRKKINDLLQDMDAVIISDYAKGVITQELVDMLLANERFLSGDLFIAADPKPSRELNLQGLSLLTPNKSEAIQLAGLSEHENDMQWLEKACKIIHQRFKPKLLIVTLGADGMAISKSGELLQILPTVARQVYDVSGAGDTVIAMLTAALISGADASSAAALANLAAGEVVSKHGTASIKMDELLIMLNK